MQPASARVGATHARIACFAFSSRPFFALNRATTVNFRVMMVSSVTSGVERTSTQLVTSGDYTAEVRLSPGASDRPPSPGSGTRSRSTAADETLTSGDRHGLSSVGGSELPHDVGDVKPDRPLADAQDDRCFPVALPLLQPLENLCFSCREDGGPGGRRSIERA